MVGKTYQTNPVITKLNIKSPEAVSEKKKQPSPVFKLVSPVVNPEERKGVQTSFKN